MADEKKSQMPVWLPSAISAFVAMVTPFLPFMQGWVSQNPSLSVAIAAAAAILSHLAPSPLAPKSE